MNKELEVKPDFIIAGAMKSGTTSMHHALNSHTNIFIPEGESEFFSVDDIDQNPVFFQYFEDKWTYQSFDIFFDQYKDWYESMYSDSKDHQVLGEDATTYLPSKKAMKRIKKYIPGVKIIVILRDPVERIISHYWHWVRTYRAIYSLEDTIQFRHGNLIQRSLYEKQIRRCFDFFPKDNVKIVLFEEFIKKQDEIIEEVLEFICLDIKNLRRDKKKYRNEGRYPKFPNISLFRNLMFRNLYGRYYLNNVRWMPNSEDLPLWKKAIIKLEENINPKTTKIDKKAKEETVSFLRDLLYERNSGLPDLIGRELSRYWPTFQDFNGKNFTTL